MGQLTGSAIRTQPYEAAGPRVTELSATLVPLTRLVHLNGAPGTGKTSLARRYLADHPLSLLIDIDGLRTQLGQWDRREESRTLARELALALAEAQLSSGHDVIVPQYVGRIEFIEHLDGLARRCGAEFVEVVLVTEPSVSIERFRRRRAELGTTGAPHPEADIDQADIDQIVHEAFDRISDICDRRPTVRCVPADADTETTYLALLTTINDPVR